jgi:hypothetical protein
MDELPCVPVGAYLSNTALRSDISVCVAELALFWGDPAQLRRQIAAWPC